MSGALRTLRGRRRGVELKRGRAASPLAVCEVPASSSEGSAGWQGSWLLLGDGGGEKRPGRASTTGSSVSGDVPQRSRGLMSISEELGSDDGGGASTGAHVPASGNVQLLSSAVLEW